MTPQQLLGRVRRTEIRTNRLMTDSMVGAYLSRFKGRGADFEELREYLAGDDVRDIDWNVTNRMGRPFVKRYREERELPMSLLVDVSGSSNFGSTVASKRELAAEVAACLAVSALGAENVHGVSLPSKYSSPGSLEDARRLAANLGMRRRTLARECPVSGSRPRSFPNRQALAGGGDSEFRGSSSGYGRKKADLRGNQIAAAVDGGPEL